MDMQHFVEEGDGLMFLHGIKEKKMPGHFCPDRVYMPAPINRRVIRHRKRGMTLGKPLLSPTWIRISHAKGICCPFLSKTRLSIWMENRCPQKPAIKQVKIPRKSSIFRNRRF
jgi:hypothetical protein